MEMASPSINAAVTDLASEGYREVVIVPYFLSPGRHITEDIPALVAEAQAHNAGVHCVLAETIGESMYFSVHAMHACRPLQSFLASKLQCMSCPVHGRGTGVGHPQELLANCATVQNSAAVGA